MRILSLILKIALFVLVVIFAVRNTDVVTVRYLPGQEWQAPLVFVLLAVFAAGIVLGLAAALPRIFRQRREISALRRDLAAGRKEAEARKTPVPGAPA
jgi:uncharacterized integral membrane protein